MLNFRILVIGTNDPMNLHLYGVVVYVLLMFHAIHNSLVVASPTEENLKALYYLSYSEILSQWAKTPFTSDALFK